ncbi:MAG TPA: acetolactate synthase large subunit [Rhizomicrobium sp.]|jgi:acetolactate synthase-1/2/3 large subunit|nr:acetolactate synthase large subunit [Rhizomicrobium sp.]
MNGAQSLVQTLFDSGVEVCFANPGTSEMHVVAALDTMPGLRGILTLFEGVATGAADGYARMAEKPAMTLLHLGPGFANGIANLHNARKAAVPVVNIVGDHATSHSIYDDAPLSSDIFGICRPVSDWLERTASARTAASDAARAVAAARAAPGHIATLLVPADAAWSAGAESAAAALPVGGPAPVASSTIDRVVRALRSGRKSALLMRGAATHRAGLEAAGRIAAATGVRLMHDYFAPRITQGAGLPRIERIPYFAEQIMECLAGLEQIVLVGAPPPVTFFAYPDRPSWMTPEGCALLTLANPHEDAVAALTALAEALGAPKTYMPVKVARLDLPQAGALNSFSMGQIMTRFLPENAIIPEDAVTSSLGMHYSLVHAPIHDTLYLTGGAIGGALPMATGAAVACPDRKVIGISGDGAAAYTLQALWTQAREKMDVTTVICANKSYAVLNVELARAGVSNIGPKVQQMLDLHDPELDWVSLARGMGVEASRAASTDDFARQFEDAMNNKGPRLIEAVI